MFVAATFAAVIHDATAEPMAGFEEFELVESAPVETGLDNDWMRNTQTVWLEMIDRAERSLDLATFYTSNAEGEALEPIIQAIERAATRGVRVRHIAEEKFYQTYPTTLDRLNARTNIEVRRLRTGDIMGGVMHAKYFVVDGEELYVGSANFDWRALDHIVELGVRIRSPEAARRFLGVFNLDWELAAGGPRPAAPPDPESSSREGPITITAGGSDSVSFEPVFSPIDWLPCDDCWDEPRIVSIIDGAHDEITLQLLTYRPVGRDGTYYDRLESALRRAGARGVTVQIILADWCKRASTIPYLKSLTLVPNITVKLITIPEWSGGFVPYARVVHAKYLVADAECGWIGTSNWERGYFHDSRNVGVVFAGQSIGRLLSRYFDTLWGCDYAYEVRAEEDYTPPRIGR